MFGRRVRRDALRASAAASGRWRRREQRDAGGVGPSCVSLSRIARLRTPTYVLLDISYVVLLAAFVESLAEYMGWPAAALALLAGGLALLNYILRRQWPETTTKGRAGAICVALVFIYWGVYYADGDASALNESASSKSSSCVHPPSSTSQGTIPEQQPAEQTCRPFG